MQIFDPVPDRDRTEWYKDCVYLCLKLSTSEIRLISQRNKSSKGWPKVCCTIQCHKVINTHCMGTGVFGHMKVSVKFKARGLPGDHRP